MIEPSQPDWKQNVPTSTGSVNRKGMLFVAMTLGVFLAWAFLFPLASAVVGDGRVISAGQNKLLQHPSGGVVRKIIASDGAVLKAGDLIAEIEPASAIAEFADLVSRRNYLVAQQARLVASKNDDPEVLTLEDDGSTLSLLRGTVNLSGLNIESVEALFSEQESEYLAGKQRFESELSALEAQLDSLNSELESTKLQVVQQRARNKLLLDQITAMRPLVDEGHVAKVRLWDLEASRLQIESQITDLEGTQEGLVARKQGFLPGLGIV